MKQLKRLSALLLALGTVCSLMAPAGAAAASPMNLLSDHAGTTRMVQVVAGDFEGNATGEYLVEVDIPAGATKGEELDLIQTAAREAAGLETPLTRAPTLRDVLSTRYNLTIASAQVVGEFPLQKNYNVLAVTFDNVSALNFANKLNVRVDNNHAGHNTWASDDIRLGSYTLVYLRTNGKGTNQGGDDLVLNRGDYITVWASADRGGASVGTVYISADTY